MAARPIIDAGNLCFRAAASDICAFSNVAISDDRNRD